MCIRDRYICLTFTLEGALWLAFDGVNYRRITNSEGLNKVTNIARLNTLIALFLRK